MAGERVLMIEDDEEMIALGELILNREGIRVLAATSGAAGLDTLRSQPIDLVLLDIMMEDMDGWEVLDRMRSDPRLKEIPVIILSARHYIEDQDQTTVRADQFASYIVKPFVVRELVDEVKKGLAARA